MKIVLIRHSNSRVEPDKYNPLWSLSDKGVARAIDIADNESIKNVEIVYSSNQLKAIHTGVIIASKIGVWLKQREDLTELTSLTNDWKEDHEQFTNDIYSGKIERHKDGESLAEAITRFTKAVEEIVETESDKKTIAIVAHGNVLSLFSSQYEDREALEIHNAIEMPDIAVLNWDTKEFETTFGNYGK